MHAFIRNSAYCCKLVRFLAGQKEICIWKSRCHSHTLRSYACLIRYLKFSASNFETTSLWEPKYVLCGYIKHRKSVFCCFALVKRFMRGTRKRYESSVCSILSVPFLRKPNDPKSASHRSQFYRRSGQSSPGSK